MEVTIKRILYNTLLIFLGSMVSIALLSALFVNLDRSPTGCHMLETTDGKAFVCYY